jgi:putative tricarboxylic transport membrane protein
MKLPEDHDAHEGTSDATPGGITGARRPGEALFTLLMLGASLFLLWNAYGISGFRALSGAGAVPMATTAIMVITSVIVLMKTLRLPAALGQTIKRDILPPAVIVLALMLVGYGLVLKPFGFLPTSALFLISAIKILGQRSWAFTLTVSLVSLVVIWIVFRIVFTVLMPPGIFPEAEIVQFLRNLFSGRGA